MKSGATRVPKARRFINRELSWLEFNRRVLAEALDDTVPLLERLKFLAITGSNLDEFFMVRVGGLRLLLKDGVNKRGPAGYTPRQQLKLVSERALEMASEQQACFSRLSARLEVHGIKRCRADKLSERQERHLNSVFQSELVSVVTPMALDDPDWSTPSLTGLRINLAVRIRDADAQRGWRVAVVPSLMRSDRFVELPADDGYQYILAEDVLRMHVGRLFPGQEVLECVPFRITRNADMSLHDELSVDLLADMQEILMARKQSDCVRLEVDDAVSEELLGYLLETFKPGRGGLHRIEGPMAFADFVTMAVLDGFEELKYEKWEPQPSPDVDAADSMFENLKRQDILLVHPYESFEPVQRLIEEAATDPHVLAIKQILYRTSRNSPIVRALKLAAENGKYVTVLVELKARFDEARNIGWARELEQAGAQVIYGVRGLKTHAKLCMIVRREEQGLMRYLHFGTGNYNELTAKVYSDVSYLTTDRDLASDASSFVNALTGYSQPEEFLKLEAAPTGLRDKLVELIRDEAERMRHGQSAMIMAKVNSLVDPALIEELCAASRAGVKVLLNVRGICCLRPGVPGVSENIRVTSVVDRFLEHARVLYFRHGGDERVFISSADWMPRNLDKRAELLIPVDDARCRRRLVRMLETCLNDNVKAWRLQSDGDYSRVPTPKGRRVVRSQAELFRDACARVERQRQRQRTVFEPHLRSD